MAKKKATKKTAAKKTTTKKEQKCECSEVEYSLEELIEAAENINDIGLLDPPINTDFDDIEEMKNELLEQCAKDIYDTDELSANTFRTLELIGVEIQKDTEEDEETEEEEEDASVTDSDDDGDEEKEKVEESKQQKKTSAKNADKKTPAKKKTGAKKDAKKKGTKKSDVKKDKKEPAKKRKGNVEALKKAHAAKNGGGPGVIASILEFIQNGPITKEDILKKLEKRFPDKEGSSMIKTINCQIGGKKSPTRMEKEKKVKFVVEDGKFSIK